MPAYLSRAQLEPPTPRHARDRTENDGRPVHAAVNSESTSPVPWYRSTLAVGLFGSLLMWASLPPLDWWLLAWIAPLPWLLLVLQPNSLGRRPGWTLYLISFA